MAWSQGLPLLMIVIGLVVLLHPVAVCVKVNVAVPAPTPVTIPALVTVALVIALLCHVPPDAGDTLVVLSTRMVVGPITLTVGMEFTLTVALNEFAGLHTPFCKTAR